jgi:hypothetical protein
MESSEAYVDPWQSLRAAEFAASNAAYQAQPGFAALVAEADARGFRPITLTEQMDCGRVDAYSWRGGVWVRK